MTDTTAAASHTLSAVSAPAASANATAPDAAPSADPAAEELRLRRELAAVYRLVAHFRMTDLIFTHISVRLPGPDHHFLINPYGLLFEEVTASNLVKIDLSGNLVEPSPYRVNPAGFMIHSAIHAARPDAQCVLHTHTKAGCAVAAQRDGLLPLNQMSMQFYNRVGYHAYEGVALNYDEQKRLVAAIGDHPALILRNHGLLTVGQSAAEAFLAMFYLERACEIQVAAQAGGGPLVTPPPDVCEYTAQQLAGEAKVDVNQGGAPHELAWPALMRLVERVAPNYKD